MALPTDLVFLKERIQTLEREKREEVERNEKREAKLFAELDVKNKQISAWDGITQGLTRALATGQIAPSLGTVSTGTESKDAVPREAYEATDVVDGEADQPTPNVVRPTKVKASKRSVASRSSHTKKRRSSTKSKPTNSTSRKRAHKHEWYEMPTLKRLLTRR